MFGCTSTRSFALLNNKGSSGGLNKRSGLNVVNTRGFGGLGKQNRKRGFSSQDSRPRKTRKIVASESGMNELPAIRGPNPLTAFKTQIPLQPFDTTEGLHPSLFEAKREIGQLTKKLNKVEEQSQFWRRKSYTLQGELTKCKKEVSELRLKVDSTENERLRLQSKLMSAAADNSKCMEGIQALMRENEDLKSVVNDVNEELRVLSTTTEACSGETCQEAIDQQHLLDLETALADTLADLTEKIEEIEILKKALEKVTVRKYQLEEVVTKDMLLKEMITVDAHIMEDPEADPIRAKMIRLQEALEKCMFRIALLSQKNKELKKEKSAGKTFPPTLLETLEDKQKVVVLESMCMQRFRKTLKKAAESLVGIDIDGDQMDESF